jgi:hypothetical protein
MSVMAMTPFVSNYSTWTTAALSDNSSLAFHSKSSAIPPTYMKHLQGSSYYHANLEEWTNVDGLQDLD